MQIIGKGKEIPVCKNISERKIDRKNIIFLLSMAYSTQLFYTDNIDMRNSADILKDSRFDLKEIFSKGKFN